MIIFVYGKERNKVREKSRARVGELRKKRPDAEFFTMDDETFNAGRFEELIFGQGLFDKKFIVHLDRVLENKDAREFVLKHLDELGKSENAFVVTEYSLAKPTFEKIKKVAFKTESFDTEKKEVKKEFNIFSLTDAFGAKDKKQLWVLYTQAVKAEMAPEQIHGTLFTHVKNMAVIKRAEKEKVPTGELGLHPFVVQKTKVHAKNYSEETLENYSRELLHMYHGARGGGDELDMALEKFILGL